MRKGRDGEKKTGGKKKKEKTDDYSGHYVIASSRPPKRRPLERRTLVPIKILVGFDSFLTIKYFTKVLQISLLVILYNNELLQNFIKTLTLSPLWLWQSSGVVVPQKFLILNLIMMK